MYPALPDSVQSVTHLYKNVPCHSEAGVFCNAEPLDEFLSHTNTVLVQQKSEDYSVS